MRDAFDAQCLELRTRIARSRRRVDRGARDLIHDVAGWVALPFVSRPRRGYWMLGAGILAAGLALSQWSRLRILADVRRQLLGTAVARGLDQLTRRLRVMAWQSRRARRAATRGSNDA